jgi:hypothetical protein
MENRPKLWLLSYTIRGKEGAALVVANEANSAQSYLLNQGYFNGSPDKYDIIRVEELFGIEVTNRDCGTLAEFKPDLSIYG